MSSAGHIFDMIRRLRGNRSQLTSNKEGFRENIPIKEKRRTFVRFKKIPKAEMEILKEGIRSKAMLEKRRYYIASFVVSVLLIVALLLILK
ncbi:hypothetical protein [Marinifilum caeruleilacunae]|uniref:Uncharacterized protein n=1 Tax=Marinifilum caeruleilacunae TaxID=2499076 RepID=A0ABX1WS88_9BACT|nr:hypothetical protein [Marinifilum caeruleilacunae]NOU58861.1 hypothetical protein [Marinifilum caeruleilacunae]